MFSMKTVLLLALFLYAAAAAPAEDKPEAPEAVAVVDPPEEQMAAVPAGVFEEEGEAPEKVPKFKPCPAHWEQIGPRCFIFFRDHLTWESAKKQCKCRGGHLASVNSLNEEILLQDIMKSKCESESWLGGSYERGLWTWVDSEDFIYTNLIHRQIPTSDYPCIYQSHSGWGNAGCNDLRSFFCSRDA